MDILQVLVSILVLMLLYEASTFLFGLLFANRWLKHNTPRTDRGSFACIKLRSKACIWPVIITVVDHYDSPLVEGLKGMEVYYSIPLELMLAYWRGEQKLSYFERIYTPYDNNYIYKYLPDCDCWELQRKGAEKYEKSS